MKTCEDCKYYIKIDSIITKMYCEIDKECYTYTKMRCCNNFKQKDMKYTKLKTNDLIKAYKNGCSDVKETLKNLYPDVEFGRKLPKTWAEYCNIVNRRYETVKFCNVETIERSNDYGHNIIQYTGTKILKEKYSAIYKLEQLRDYYNDGWVADWECRNEKKYVIYKINKEINKDIFYEKNIFLSFKTKELRDTFLDNFKELIEQAEDLI